MTSYSDPDPPELTDPPAPEILAGFRSAHPAPSPEVARRLGRLGNALIGASVTLTCLGVVGWMVVPTRSAVDRLLVVALPLMAVVGALLRQRHQALLEWAETFPDRVSATEAELAGLLAIDRFDSSLGWTVIPSAALTAWALYRFHAVDPHLDRFLELSLWAGMPIATFIAISVGYWLGRRRRGGRWFRVANLCWAFVLATGVLWAANVVWSPGAGHTYVATVARSYEDPYAGYYGELSRALYLGPFPAAPGGLRVLDPPALGGDLVAGAKVRITVVRGGLGALWLRGLGLGSGPGS